jgi:hypothetical protein
MVGNPRHYNFFFFFLSKPLFFYNLFDGYIDIKNFKLDCLFAIESKLTAAKERPEIGEMDPTLVYSAAAQKENAHLPSRLHFNQVDPRLCPPAIWVNILQLEKLGNLSNPPVPRYVLFSFLLNF